MRGNPKRIAPGAEIGAIGQDMPLADYRVLDLSESIAGCAAARILGGWEAETIKVEGPQTAAKQRNPVCRMAVLRQCRPRRRRMPLIL